MANINLQGEKTAKEATLFDEIARLEQVSLELYALIYDDKVSVDEKKETEKPAVESRIAQAKDNLKRIISRLKRCGIGLSLLK